MSWAWWNWFLTWLTNHHPSVLWHCWLGHLTRKIFSEMTYNMSSGMLNTTIPYHTICWRFLWLSSWPYCWHRQLYTQGNHYKIPALRVTTCLENLEMSGHLKLSGKCQGIYEKSGKCQGEILSGKSCLKLFIVSCIFASIQVFSTSTGMIWVTLDMPSATEECREPSGNFTLSVHISRVTQSWWQFSLVVKCWSWSAELYSTRPGEYQDG